MTIRIRPAPWIAGVAALALGTLFLPPASFSTTIEHVSSGVGPAVGLDFAVVAFDDEMGEGAFVAWRDPQSRVASGLLDFTDGSFEEFSPESVAGGTITNLRAGVGGPTADRRLYVTWVDDQLQLLLMAFDRSGNQIRAPHVVANSVQVVPVGTAGIDAGLVLGYSWDAGFDWDPRSLVVDLAGNGLVEQRAESVSDQTLGVDVAAVPSGRYAMVYDVGGVSETPRVRRYDENGPIDSAAIELTNIAGPARSPFATLVEPAGAAPFWFFGFSHSSPTHPDDLRFVHLPLVADFATAGPVLSDLEPAYPGYVADLSALAGGDAYVAALWQTVERQEDCLCSVPPPVRVEHLVTILEAGIEPTAAVPLHSAYLWVDGDPEGPPLTPPVLAAADQTPGRFAVLWSDGALRYEILQVQSTTAVDPPSARRMALLEPIFPNPFNPRATLRFSLFRDGHVRLDVFDARGRRVRQLVNGTLSAGEHAFSWDGTDDRGDRVISGAYRARLEFRGERHSTGVVLVE